jgi:hypothetical protein
MGFNSAFEVFKVVLHYGRSLFVEQFCSEVVCGHVMYVALHSVSVKLLFRGGRIRFID